MKKIVYLFILGILFLIPKNVRALEYVKIYPQYSGVFNCQNTMVNVNPIVVNANKNNIYKFIAYSKENFGIGSCPITMASTYVEMASENIDLKKYDYMLISLYGTPAYDVKIAGRNCFPSSSVVATEDSRFSVGTYICPAPTKSSFWLDTYFINTLSMSLWFIDSITLVEKDNSSSEISSAINSQTEEITSSIDKQTQATNDLNDTMNNSDVDMDGANSFFGDFSNTDHGGISGVITAPLRFVNKITQTCSPLSIDVLGADVQLPCGNTLFWEKPEVANFRTIWNILFGGAFLYLMITKLFKVIEGLKNPDDSRIEVMKL